MDYGLVQSFDIDGQLRDFAHEKAFVLGVEYGMMYATIGITYNEFNATIHSENLNRIMKMLAENGRSFLVLKTSHGYIDLAIGALH